jgi:FlaA1/EpsC-like NDP-sugar epimerase
MLFSDKTIVVTGGTGSLGKILVQRILSGEMGQPKKIIVLSRDEAKQHAMRLSYLHKRITTDEVIYNNFLNLLEFRIGDVRDYTSVCRTIKDANYVINAAALKQVPTCEYFPEQALMTNCQGAVNITRAIIEQKYSVDTVVGVSTDKACKPVNVMGMTKALQERIFTSANILAHDTRFICVRYGNVLASRGSVIPLFHEQIQSGGPVTLTIPSMTRFLLSIHQAVDTIFAALKNAKRGETFIPVVPSATVENIAKALIADKPVEIKVTGIRPGEKMHEILVSEEERYHTVTCDNYYAIQSMLPELREKTCSSVKELPLKKEYSSEDAVLNLTDTIALLKKHNLLLGELPKTSGEELLA